MNSKFNKDSKVLIVGLGLIGGSYAEALTDKGYFVGAVARRKETIDYALDRALIKSGITDMDPDYISDFDIIVFALYPNVFKKWVRENQKFILVSTL